MLIEPVAPEMLDEDGVLIPSLGTLQATCPHCKSESIYRSDEIRCEVGQRWSRFPGQFGGLAKVDSGFDYAANFSSFACVA